MQNHGTNKRQKKTMFSEDETENSFSVQNIKLLFSVEIHPLKRSVIFKLW